MNNQFIHLLYVAQNALFEVVWFPFRQLPPWPALLLFSLVCGIVLLELYRLFSPERRLRRINDQILGLLMETWYARDSIRLVLAAQARLIGLGLKKLVVVWKALLVLIVVVVWILAGLEPWCEWRPFQVGDKAIVVVRTGEKLLDDVALKVSGEGRLESPAVRIPTRGEVAWRLGFDGDAAVQLVVNNKEPISVPVHYKGELLAKLSPENELRLSTGERLPMTFQYPERRWRVGPGPIGWIWIFCVVALASGWIWSAFRKPVACYGPQERTR